MSLRVIISGGGTGGHIFPAISIANELKRIQPSTEILFVGAKGGMEMTLVPRNNYKIEAVWISGIMRRITPANILKNLVFPLKLITSLSQAKRIIRQFRPDVVVGVGGYASGPLGRAAAKRGIPLVLQEQNAYPGITNKWLAPLAKRVLLGNEAASKYFEASKVRVTGNPVRQTLKDGNRDRAIQTWNLNPAQPVVLSLGGSLGAGTLNNALENNLGAFSENGVQLLWQCGKRYHEELKARLPENKAVRLLPFIEKMEDAYAVADLVITRAGASTLSELILLSKPSILVPSPNVAEDHQTKNALSLVDKGAALMVKDAESAEKLVAEAMRLLKDKPAFDRLKENITATEKHDAANLIAREIMEVAKQ